MVLWLLKDVIDQLLDKPLVIQLLILETQKKRSMKMRGNRRRRRVLISKLSITFSAFRADHPPMEA